MIIGERVALYAGDGQDVTPKGRKARAILAYLATHPGQKVRRERLVDLLWGNRFASQARLSLRQSLFEIRRCAGDQLICSDREHLWIEPFAIEVESHKGGDELYGGLTGITSEFDEWLRMERDRLSGEAFAKLGDEAERLIAGGSGPEALPLIERMRQIDSLHESWVRLAMKADHQAGNVSGIHRRFNEFSDLLKNELGVAPASETRALHDWLIADLNKPERQPQRSPTQAEAELPEGARRPGRYVRTLLRELRSSAGKRRIAITVAVIVPFVLVALVARDTVATYRQQAEGMAELLLGEAKNNVQPAGKIDAIEGVASRIVDFYQGKSNSELSDPELGQRSRALALLAQAQDMRGNMSAAIELYEQAAAGTAESVRRKPDDPQRLFDHAQNVFWIGEIERQRGNIDAEEAAYRKYKQLATRMSALDPDNLKWRMEVIYANEDIGIALMAKRRFVEASGQFESALQPMESVVLIDPLNGDYQKELVNVLGWVADGYRASGRLGEAVAARQRQVAYLEKLVSNHAQDVDLRAKSVPAHEGLGILFADQGQAERGVQQFELALQEADRLVLLEPKNSGWKDLDANVRLELATTLLSIGRNVEAAGQVSVGCATASELLRRDFSVVRWRLLRTLCFSAQARLALANGASSQALTMAQKALASARSQRSGDPIQDRYLAASAYRLLGDVRARSGDSMGAKATWSEALAQLPANTAERPWEMKEHAELLSRLGRRTEQVPIMARLSAIGYRRAS